MDIADGLTILGALVFTGGLYMIWPPVALLFAGLALWSAGLKLNGKDR